MSPSYLMWILLAGAAAYIFYLLWTLNKERSSKKKTEKKFSELEGKVNSLELENIKYKLNPHLFKNALNSIQSHAYQTYYSLEKLSNVLDFILYESDRQFVSLKEELDFALSLIEINRIKLSPLFDLNIKKKIAENNPFFTQDIIAPLITVDLIENAFKHADLQSEDAFISIVFELTDEFFLLTVSNRISSKPMLNNGRSGFGRQSFQKRLEIIYKNNFKLDQTTENGVYTSHLKINLLEHKAQMLIAG